MANKQSDSKQNNIHPLSLIAGVVIAGVLIFIGVKIFQSRNSTVDSIPFANPDLEIITTDSGLQYQEITVGSGALAQAGQIVSVHYTGWLEDGTKFDSSVDRDAPFEFNLGRGDVIQGWDEGVAGMQVGGKRLLIIPASLGYGDAGAGGTIPPGATLIFEVELLDIK